MAALDLQPSNCWYGCCGNRRATNRADILNANRAAGREIDSSTDFESETLHRMKERHVKMGVAKKEHFAISQRRLVN